MSIPYQGDDFRAENIHIMDAAQAMGNTGANREKHSLVAGAGEDPLPQGDRLTTR